MKTVKFALHILILFVACLQLVPATAEAATTGQTIQGTVYYSTTPVAGIQINLYAQTVTNPPLATTVSDNAGRYVLTNIPAGTYILEVLPPTNDWVGKNYILQDMTGEGTGTLDVYVRKNINVLQPKADAVLITPQPVFCWQPLEEAVRYSVQIIRRNDYSRVEYQENIPSTCYQTTSVLKVGATYEWFLSAWDADGREIGVNHGYAAQKFTINTPIFLPFIAR